MGFIEGAYSPRHASAKAPQSVFTPVRRVSSSPSRITDPRQSTTVPKTSKASAFTWPRTGELIADAPKLRAALARSLEKPLLVDDRPLVAPAHALARRILDDDVECVELPVAARVACRCF